ncbi:MAG TPA: hypothetical protein VGV38_01800 [Pyrinomonadaceae bacterium]|nr:hypothetical protein [Pyrinomonadaceae bacterium]
MRTSPGSARPVTGTLWKTRPGSVESNMTRRFVVVRPTTGAAPAAVWQRRRKRAAASAGAKRRGGRDEVHFMAFNP